MAGTRATGDPSRYLGNSSGEKAKSTRLLDQWNKRKSDTAQSA